MSKRYLWIVAALLVLGGGFLFAGGSQESSAGKATTFTVFFHFTPQEARGVVFRDFVSAYNKEHAGKVDVRLSYFADWIPMQQKIRTMVAAGEPPDVFYFNFNPNDLSLFKSGQLLDFSPYMDAKWRERFYPSDLESLTYDGKLLAIPGEQGPVVFYYNKALLAKVGVTSLPVTWDDFFALADKLKAAGIGAASLFTADDAWHATNFLSYFAAEAGGPRVFASGASLDSPPIVKAASMLQRLFHYAAADAIGAKWAVSVQDFVQGRTAVLVDGPWVIGVLDGQMKDPGEVVAGPAPVLAQGDPSVLVTDAVTPWAASAHLSDPQKQAVVAFMKTFTSEPVMKQFAVKGKDIFAVKLSLDPAETAEAGAKLAANIHLASTADQKIVQITRVLKPSAMNQVPSLIERLALGQITPEDFASSLQRYNQQ